MQEVIGADLREFKTTGSLGVVNDTKYVRCYWPALDSPVELFAKGSSGIQVQGPPTPRNVIFPVDTAALPTSINDGNFSNPSWRDSSATTNLNCYFTREKVATQVDEPVSLKATVEVEPGLVKEVEYQKSQLITKPVDTITREFKDREEALIFIGTKV